MEFEEFAQTRKGPLLRTAFALTMDEHLAQDLVQSVLGTAWSRWIRIGSMQYPDAYVRKMLFTQYLSWRRLRRWQEVPASEVPDVPTTDRAAFDLDLLAAIRQLPRRQRAVIVLRYLEDCTEAETAQVLECAVGTVKSQTAKALSTLRVSPLLTASKPVQTTDKKERA